MIKLGATLDGLTVSPLNLLILFFTQGAAESMIGVFIAGILASTCEGTIFEYWLFLLLSSFSSFVLTEPDKRQFW